MKIKGTSSYRNATDAKAFLEHWNYSIQKLNHSYYDKISVRTSLGKTIVWGYNTDRTDLDAIVIFPGFRTSALFWDFNNNLAALKKNYRIYIADINGQPNLSDGNSPYLQSNDYGVWAAELFKKLEISKATVIGASFGGIVCMKLCIAAPHLVEKAILMNPAGFIAFSSSFQNLYYNFLPIIFKSRFAVKQFVNKIALHPPQHDLPLAYKNLLTDYILYTIRNFKNKAELPSPMEADDLKKIAAGIYLIHGENDLLFPPAKTISIAKKNIALLEGIHVLAHTAHGIETSKAAINIVAGIMNAKYASI